MLHWCIYVLVGIDWTPVKLASGHTATFSEPAMALAARRLKRQGMEVRTVPYRPPSILPGASNLPDFCDVHNLPKRFAL